MKLIPLLALLLSGSQNLQAAYQFDSFHPADKPKRFILGAELISPSVKGGYLVYEHLLASWLDFVSSVEGNSNPNGELAVGTKIILGRDLPIQLHVSERLFVRRPQNNKRFLPGAEITPVVMIYPKPYSFYAGYSFGINYLLDQEQYVPIGLTGLWGELITVFIEMQAGVKTYDHRLATGLGFDW